MMYYRRTRLLAVLMAVLMLLSLSATALAAEKEEVAVEGEYMQAAKGVNVRSGPGTKYDKIGSLKKGTVVLRVDTSGSWSVISLGEDQTAYRWRAGRGRGTSATDRSAGCRSPAG